MDKLKVMELAKEWEVVWKRRPFDNNNGLSCLSAFSLFYFLREMNPKPEFVFEIGTWRGFSTWVIREALPSVDILCSDPILASRHFLDRNKFQSEYRLKDVEYTWQDFSNIDIQITGEDRDKVVVFFDDHQNKIPRVNQAVSKGIRHMIFDDNVPYEYTHDTFECIFSKRPDLKVELLSYFRRYCVFPLLFESNKPNMDNLKPLLDEKYATEYPFLYEGKDKYSWLTKIEV